MPARRKRYARVIEMVPPCRDVHHQKQTLYPSCLPLAEAVCSFVTNFRFKKREGPEKELLTPRGKLVKALESELRPKQQVTECRFDRILLVQVTACSDMVQVDVERGDVVMVGKVLRFDAEDEHAALEVQPGGRNVLLRSDVPILRVWVDETVASHFLGGELRSVGYKPMHLVSGGGGVGHGVVVDTGSEGGIKVVVPVETGGVDRSAWIANEWTVVRCAAVKVHVYAADVERTVIARLQLCRSGDGDVAREGA